MCSRQSASKQKFIKQDWMLTGWQICCDQKLTETEPVFPRRIDLKFPGHNNFVDKNYHK